MVTHKIHHLLDMQPSKSRVSHLAEWLTDIALVPCNGSCPVCCNLNLWGRTGLGAYEAVTHHTSVASSSVLVPMSRLLQPSNWVCFWTCRPSVTWDLCTCSSFYLQWFSFLTVIGPTPTISSRDTFHLASLSHFHCVHQYKLMYVYHLLHTVPLSQALAGNYI